MIQFVRWNVISLAISTVVGKPKLLCLRMPIKSDGVADTAGKYLEIAAVGLHAHDRGIAIRVRFTNIARRTDWHVEISVRPERNKFPTMLAIMRKAIVDDDGLWRVLEPRLDVVVTEHAIDLCHVKRAIFDRDTVWHVKALSNDQWFVDLRSVIASLNRINLTRVATADEQRAVRTEGHGARVRNLCIELDLKTRRQSDFVDGQTITCSKGDSLCAVSEKNE